MTTATLERSDVAPAATTAARKQPLAKRLLPALVGFFVVLGFTIYLVGRGKESTDDAFVEGHVATVAARTQGQVLRVLVTDNQAVHVGDVLVELDDLDAQARLLAANADTASAKANLSAAQANFDLVSRVIDANLAQAKGGVTQAKALSISSKSAIEQARAEVTGSEARRKLAETELKRAQELRANGAVTNAELESKRSAFDSADADLTQAKARLLSANASVGSAAGSVETAKGVLSAADTGAQQIEVARAQVDVATARVAQAEAAQKQAELNLSYTKVRASGDGIVSRRTVEVGQLVDPSRPLMAITSLKDVWVVANFKEDQLEGMRAGQSAVIKVDAFGGRKFAGRVDSLAGGTGSRFSLLPPDNASGNFTKVVQRVPVLLRFDSVPSGVVLRPGMSVEVTVRTSESGSDLHKHAAAGTSATKHAGS